MIELDYILSFFLTYVVYRDVELHPSMDKWIWVAVTFLFPILGIILYWLRREKLI